MKTFQGERKMKKLLTLLLATMLCLCACVGLTACGDDGNEGNNGPTLYVYTNSGFAPYEYLSTDGKVVGVDVDIMNAIGSELGYNVVINDIDFEQILNEVAANKLAVGAAGMTKKAERDAVTTASISYATSVQYVIVEKGVFTEADLVDGKLSISQLSKIENAGIGVQSGTTGSFLV
jgi:polar amino acid transport system substrate-binding protein